MYQRSPVEILSPGGYRRPPGTYTKSLGLRRTSRVYLTLRYGGKSPVVSLSPLFFESRFVQCTTIPIH